MKTTTLPSPIALLTDFGERGTYVGAMKGVIATLAPGATIIDLTHRVTPQAVREGAFLLHGAYRYLPPGTIFVAVVDPGVGTARRAIALAVPGVGHIVGPDNGLFTPLLDEHPEAEAREIVSPAFMLARHGQAISPTFHGRDIFAPTAALLARGEPFAAVGPPIARDHLHRLDPFWADWDDATTIQGAVVHIDSFGNLLSNIPQHRLAGLTPAQRATLVVTAGPHRCVGLHGTYGEAAPGTVIALVGSGGTLEVARVNGRGDRDGRGRTLGLGLPIQLRLAP